MNEKVTRMRTSSAFQSTRSKVLDTTYFLAASIVRDDCSMIAAPIQCDVDGIPKRLHYARVPPMG